mgnify:FL=1
MRKTKLVVLAAMILMTGCSSLNPFAAKPKNSPADLVSFKPTMAVRTVWSLNVGKAGDQLFKPAISKDRIFAASESGDIV